MKTLYIDEVNRGGIFGPIMAGGVVFDETFDDNFPNYIKDSKKLKEPQIAKANAWIVDNALWYKITKREASEIDTLGIEQCNYLIFKDLIDAAPEDVGKVIIDGVAKKIFQEHPAFSKFEFHIQSESKFKGSAAASCLAKHAQIQSCYEFVDTFPELSLYGIQSNRGYGSSDHIEAIRIYGYSDFHRKSYNIKKLG